MGKTVEFTGGGAGVTQADLRRLYELNNRIRDAEREREKLLRRIVEALADGRPVQAGSHVAELKREYRGAAMVERLVLDGRSLDD